MADKKSKLPPTLTEQFLAKFPTGVCAIEIDVYWVSEEKNPGPNTFHTSDGTIYRLRHIGEERLTASGIWEWRCFDLDSDVGPRWSLGVFSGECVRKMRSIEFHNGQKHTFKDE